MSNLRSFFVGLPLACGVEPKLAKVYGEHLGNLFDYEVTNPDGEFSRGRHGNTAKRLAYAFHGWSDFADPSKLHYGLMLAVFAANAYDKNAKGLKVDGFDESKAVLAAQEPDHPEIANLLTVQTASVLTTWV
jgi:hypothetical protein